MRPDARQNEQSARKWPNFAPSTGERKWRKGVGIYIYIYVKGSWYRKVGGKLRRGITFAWRQHRFFFIDFSLLALSHEKLEKTGKKKEEEEEQ